MNEQDPLPTHLTFRTCLLPFFFSFAGLLTLDTLAPPFECALTAGSRSLPLRPLAWRLSTEPGCGPFLGFCLLQLAE
jgi:hypothetical protein